MSITLHNGVVADNPTTLTDKIRISVPDLLTNDRRVFGPLPFDPIVSGHGGTRLPQAGDRAVVGVDEGAGEQWVVSWHRDDTTLPPYTEEGGFGSGGNTGVGGGNFIPNPSFNNGVIGHTLTGGVLTVSSLVGLFGNAAGVLTKTGGSGNLSFLSDRAVVAPQLKFSASVWLRRGSSVVPTVRSMSIRINWYDSVNSLISSSPVNTFNDSVQNVWTRLYVTGIVSPDNAAFARIEATVIDVVGGDIYYIDGMQLEPGDAPTSFNSNFPSSALTGSMLAPEAVTVREVALGSARVFVGLGSSLASITTMVNGSVFIATDSGAISVYSDGFWFPAGGSSGGGALGPLYDFPFTIDPRLGSGNRAITPNNLYFYRIQGGGTINGWDMQVGTGDGAGTAYAGVYNNVGSGRGARPSTPKAGASGSVGLSGTGPKTVPFGGPVSVAHGDWAAFGTNSATATFLTSAALTGSITFVDALSRYQAAILPTFPNPVGTTTPYNMAVVLVGA